MDGLVLTPLEGQWHGGHPSLSGCLSIYLILTHWKWKGDNLLLTCRVRISPAWPKIPYQTSSRKSLCNSVTVQVSGLSSFCVFSKVLSPALKLPHEYFLGARFSISLCRTFILAAFLFFLMAHCVLLLWIYFVFVLSPSVQI